MSSGSPPTLWCDLMFALSPPPDSTMSGYSVPCTRNARRPRCSARSRAASSKTRMNSLADDLALAFGFDHVVERAEEPVGRLHVHEVDRELAAERSSRPARPRLARSKPVSTKTHVSWSPIALCTSAAATAESTPPESPQITRSSPTCARISVDGLLDDRDVRPGRRGSPRRRRGTPSASPWPRSVCPTSGWNCTP